MSDLLRITLTSKAPEAVRIPDGKREFVEAPEPGTYHDPFTGKLKRQRPPANGTWWWGDLLDRVRR
ncbi:hypothetical protein [Methylobacterium sp. J-068]|uniref:hypothetical protein n=1 Tax=Methylobacterium sp. J-068 TaxID=2836649 RepID=UPI001FBB5A93|nr:hypothetical protein [Methylobacterium sp. J-068]MCJ2035763.1 hypothetical protein [Methylobacterium sp. J-068]